MRPIERVSLTLQHKEADRVPVYPLLCGVSRKLVNASYPEWSLDMDVCGEAYERVTEQFNLDIICTLIDLSVEAADFGQKNHLPRKRGRPSGYNRLPAKKYRRSKKNWNPLILAGQNG